MSTMTQEVGRLSNTFSYPIRLRYYSPCYLKHFFLKHNHSISHHKLDYQ